MNAEGSAAAPGFLHRTPSAWLIVPTLALLGGQALAAGPLRPPAYSLALLLLPLPFVFRRGARRWAIIALVAGVAFAVGYRRHLDVLEPVFAANHIRLLMDDGGGLYIVGRPNAQPHLLPRRTPPT